MRRSLVLRRIVSQVHGEFSTRDPARSDPLVRGFIKNKVLGMI